jgi:hypothetical protein
VRYRGLQGGQIVSVSVESPGLVVKAAVARQQQVAEAPKFTPSGTAGETSSTAVTAGGSGEERKSETGSIVAHSLRRFHGTVRLDAARVGRDASRIADEVISHLAGQVGAEVTVTLEIEASLPGGASDQIVRIVTENSRTLKFTNHGFEKE